MCSVERVGNVYILTLTGSGEHRLNPTLIDSIRSSLEQIKSDADASPENSCVLITTAHGKYFSNGYDLSWAESVPSLAASRITLMSSKLRALVSELISFPMPTIAAVSGHASAAGYVLALSHDYILMRKDRGFLYMSEMDIRLKIPAWFMSMVTCKIGSGRARREVVLRARKLTAEEGVKLGIVDEAYDSAEETVKGAVRLGEELAQRKWDGQVYGETRKKMMSEVLDALGVDETVGDTRAVASRL